MMHNVGSAKSRQYHIIQREASALLFLLRWAMREPRKAERATIQAFTLLFINQSVQSGRPTGHGNTIMKEENKKEELQSRRSFFKNAAKAALPILGAIALVNMPTIAKAAQSESGYCTCSGNCSGACSGTCVSNCRVSCGNSCKGTCSYTCDHTCKGSCNGR